MENERVSWRKRIVEKVVKGYTDLSGIEACTICGVSIQERQGPLCLCRPCFQTVPWITDVRCPTCGRGIECGDCVRRNEAYFIQNRSAVRYDDTMKDWLARWKYRGDERMAAMFGDMLLHPYHSYLEQGIRFDLISFVPVTAKRFSERGFNQAEKLAEGLGRKVRLPVRALLERVVHTEKQSFKSRQERLSDLEAVFSVRDEAGLLSKDGVTPRTVLLIDDVFTTGSTLNQCARHLHSVNHTTVYGITWAR